MKNKIYLIFALLLMSLFTNAQNESQETFTDFKIIKYSPMSLVNIHFPAIQFAYEHSLTEKRSMQYELGGILLNRKITNYRLTVGRVLLEHRWYKAPFNRAERNTYQSIGFRFQKQYQHDKEFVQKGGIIRLTKSYTATGFYYSRGIQWKYNENMFFEFGGALGIQYYDVSVLNIPEGTNESDYGQYEGFLNFWAYGPGNLVVPMAFLVLKVGFDYRK